MGGPFQPRDLQASRRPARKRFSTVRRQRKRDARVASRDSRSDAAFALSPARSQDGPWAGSGCVKEAQAQGSGAWRGQKPGHHCAHERCVLIGRWDGPFRKSLVRQSGNLEGLRQALSEVSKGDVGACPLRRMARGSLAVSHPQERGRRGRGASHEPSRLGGNGGLSSLHVFITVRPDSGTAPNTSISQSRRTRFARLHGVTPLGRRFGSRPARPSNQHR